MHSSPSDRPPSLPPSPESCPASSTVGSYPPFACTRAHVMLCVWQEGLRAHSRTLTTGKLDSTPHERCPASPPRRSGESLPEADCLQSVSGNSRVLDTLDAKLQVPANFKSGCSSRAFEQLESGARHSQLLHLDVQLKAVPGSSVTTWSITGVCCPSPPPPATPSHSLRPSLADGCS